MMKTVLLLCLGLHLVMLSGASILMKSDESLSVPSGSHPTSPVTVAALSELEARLEEKISLLDARLSSLNETFIEKASRVASSCSELKDRGFTSGVFDILSVHKNETFPAYCDMDRSDGPWMLVLNFNFDGSSTLDVEMTPMETAFPMFDAGRAFGTSSLGENDWGSASPSLMSKITFSTIRFFCYANTPGRTVHFKMTSPSVVDYFKTGTMSTRNQQILDYKAATLLEGHNAVIPHDSETVVTAVPQTNYPMMSHTVYVPSMNHWVLPDPTYTSRFYCDDTGSASPLSKHHIWVQ